MCRECPRAHGVRGKKNGYVHGRQVFHVDNDPPDPGSARRLSDTHIRQYSIHMRETTTDAGQRKPCREAQLLGPQRCKIDTAARAECPLSRAHACPRASQRERAATNSAAATAPTITISPQSSCGIVGSFVLLVLHEANGLGVLTEAAAAEVEAVLADQTTARVADAAASTRGRRRG